jgi:hypothetical protein
MSPAAVTESASPLAPHLSSPRRPMRPLSPSAVGLAEHLTRQHVATVAAGTPIEHITNSEFWSLIAERFRPADRIDVHDAGGRFFIELYVRQASRPTPGQKGNVLVHVLRHITFDELDSKPRQTVHEVKFLGPAQGWSVVRIADQKVIVENLESREVAEKRLAAMGPN